VKVKAGVWRRLGLGLGAFALTACNAGLQPAPSQPGVETEALDWSAEPCSDFYQFACGNWGRWHAIETDVPATSRYTRVQRNEIDLEYQIVREDAAMTPHLDDPYASKIGDYYNSCRQALEADAVSAPILTQQLGAIAAATTGADLARVIASLHVAGVAALFSLYVSPDPEHPTAMEVALGPGWLGMDAFYFLDPAAPRFRDAYRAHVDALVRIAATASPIPAAVTGDLVLRIETALAQAQPTPEQWRDPRALYNPTDLDVLRTGVPGFDWDTYLGAGSVPPITTVDLASRSYFTALDHLLTTTALADVKAYLAWRALEAAAPALGKQVGAVEFDFHRRLFDGTAADFPPWWRCFLNAESDMGFAVSRPFVAQIFGPDWRAEASRMLEAIRARMGDTLDGVPWLDAPTRAEARTKLADVVAKIGFPETPGQWVSYDDLQTTPDDFLQNLVARRTKSWLNAMADLQAPADRTRWQMAPVISNAYYSPDRNDIVFPAAILQPPFFDLGRPAAANFGSIGSVMGHELTHGFDDEGRHFDGIGTLRDWWSPGVATEFNRRAQCLVDQYDRYAPLPGAMVDGALTLGENIADLGGLKLAYAAFHAPDGGDGEGAPGHFTPDQQFFLAYAQGWCEKDRPAFLRGLLQSDPHPPWQTRINGAVTNVPEFAAAFRCPTGAPLAPASRCAIW
jgi:putative endopeptidase